LSKKGKTQKQVAEILGCSQQFLSRWKRGKSGIKKETAIIWGEKLGIDPQKLVFDPVDARSSLLGLDR